MFRPRYRERYIDKSRVIYYKHNRDRSEDTVLMEKINLKYLINKLEAALERGSSLMYTAIIRLEERDFFGRSCIQLEPGKSGVRHDQDNLLRMR